MPEANVILIVGEIIDARLSTATSELLNAGSQLAGNLGQPLHAVLLGTNLQNAFQEAVCSGASKVFLAEHPLLNEGHVEAHVAALQQVVEQAQPRIVLIARTPLGRELGPRLAFRLGVGLAQDAVALSVDPGTKQFLITRPVYGGNAMAVVTLTGKPQIVTVRPKAFEAAPQNKSIEGELVRVPVEIPNSVVRTRVIEHVAQESAGVKLEEARVVIAGGRGLGGPVPFAELEKLAKLLGGAVGASRPACDAGWIDPRFQIGLTGKTITPELYIAVAISGACQHMAGCSGAKVIVAVNNNAEAEIFKQARYGVIGDWKKIIPAFTETIRELVG
jgi:electron transfer flavoprotein alpha subunit